MIRAVRALGAPGSSKGSPTLISSRKDVTVARAFRGGWADVGSSWSSSKELGHGAVGRRPDVGAHRLHRGHTATLDSAEDRLVLLECLPGPVLSSTGGQACQ